MRPASLEKPDNVTKLAIRYLSGTCRNRLVPMMAKWSACLLHPVHPV